MMTDIIFDQIRVFEKYYAAAGSDKEKLELLKVLQGYADFLRETILMKEEILALVGEAGMVTNAAAQLQSEPSRYSSRA
jgi:hypothetical protein